jgi:hypothetical protein
MANVIYNPGKKDSFEDVSKILNLWGQAEYERQKRNTVEGIISAMARGDDQAVQDAISRGVKPNYKGGIPGAIQKISTPFMQGSPVVGAMQEAMPMLQQQQSAARTAAEVQRSGAMSDYYRGAGRKTGQRSTGQELTSLETARAIRMATLERSNKSAREMDPNAQIVDPTTDPVLMQIEQKINDTLSPGQRAAQTKAAVKPSQKPKVSDVLKEYTESPEYTETGKQTGRVLYGLSDEMKGLLANESPEDQREIIKRIHRNGEDAVMKAIARAKGK